jgi:hypothetical protein
MGLAAFLDCTLGGFDPEPAHAPARYWTEAERRSLCRMVRAGVSYAAIGLALGRSPMSARSQASRWHFSKRRAA